MSKRPSSKLTSSFASRTAFDALAVSDSEEEQEQEEQEVEVPPPSDAKPSVTMNEPPKVSKTAQKKTSRQARQSKQEKKAKRSTSVSASPARSHATTDTQPPSGSPGSQFNPVEIPPETESEMSAVLVDAEVPENASFSVSGDVATGPTPEVNGHAPHSETVPLDSPLFSATGSSSKPAAFPTSPVDIAMRKASQSLAVNPLSLKTEAIDARPRASSAISAPEPDEKEIAEKTKKRESFLVRTRWTFIMIGGFLLCLMGGHAYMIMLVMVCETLVYREVTALFTSVNPKSRNDKLKDKDPWSKTLNWYFFVVGNFFLYGESIIYYFKHVVFADWHFSLFAANHRFTSFTLYMIGFVGFVASLQRQYLKSQFGLFCWVHMTLLLIVVSSHFIMNNILEGLIWFWVPASLVICNDIFAYVWGITLGRTPLTQLSPKKTVEGFIGAFFSTIVFAQLWGTFFMRFPYMICPAHNLGLNAFSEISCAPNPVFQWHAWKIPVALRVVLQALPGLHGVETVPYTPYQFHLLVMSCFASLVAPFGGFFASGFKRAFNIKDFGHSIPGHGGMTDRMDCQFLMGIFTYVYYSSLVKEHHVTVGHVLQLIVSGLTLEEQIELMADFKRYLEGRGVTE
ncbi:CDS1 [Sanghuangporus sanghuang]